jgi:hypothetical protein
MYAVIDVETTGLRTSWHDRIIELAVVLVDEHGRVRDEWCSLINPDRDLGLQQIHGITLPKSAAHRRSRSLPPASPASCRVTSWSRTISRSTRCSSPPSFASWASRSRSSPIMDSARCDSRPTFCRAPVEACTIAAARLVWPAPGALGLA